MSVNKRKCLAIREKVEIIQELERGEKNVEVCKKFNLSPSTVSTLWKTKKRFYLR
jgi:DNA-binding NarL/FixJ family response regulator